MAQQRSIEVKVGIFALVCVAIIVGMIIRFGKYTQLGNKTYTIEVMFPNVGGIVKEANVMYAGIGIGKVKDIQLVEKESMKVKLTLGIYQGVVIRQDAKFVINQSGLLGDRYVDVVPGSTTAEPLKAGDVMEGQTSVDLSEAIRSVVDVLRQTATTIERVDKAIARIDEMVLSTQNLTHVSATIANLDLTTSNTVMLASELRSAVSENRQRVENLITALAGTSGDISNTVARFAHASENVERVTKRADDLLANNEKNIEVAAKNAAESAQRLNTILERLEKGEGTAGKILVDPTLHEELVKLVENWRKYGLLYKEGNRRSPTRTEEPRKSVPILPARPAKTP